MTPTGALRGWQLLEQIGYGGNATVWRAYRDDPDVVLALKVLRDVDRSDTYQRFSNEVAILKRLGEIPGVLPLVDAYVPDGPSPDDPPWLAMPVAVPLRSALADGDLVQIVTALAEIAETLADLAASHDLGHRDIKPNNLYEYRGRFVVGDFGLVHAPDLAEITRSGMRVGAAGYMPSEMLANAATADPKPADVYALCKTLWVLGCDQKWPLIGFQPANQPGARLSDLNQHPRAVQLDGLLEAATRIDPVGRPTMLDVATELRLWLDPPKERRGPIDFGDDADRLRAAFTPQMRERELAEQREERAYDARDRLNALLEPMYQQLDTLSGGSISDGFDQLTENYAGTPQEMGGIREPVWRSTYAMLVKSGPDYDTYALRIGYCLELFENEDLRLAGVLTAGPEEYSGGELVAIPEAHAKLGSLGEAKLFSDFVEQVEEHLPGLVKAYLRQIAPG